MRWFDMFVEEVSDKMNRAVFSAILQHMEKTDVATAVSMSEVQMNSDNMAAIRQQQVLSSSVTSSSMLYEQTSKEIERVSLNEQESMINKLMNANMILTEQIQYLHMRINETNNQLAALILRVEPILDLKEE